MVKAIEENADVPVAHMLTIVPISLSVGANRLIPTVAIPHPLGDPTKSPEEEKKLRRHLVDKAIKALETEVTEQTVFND
ncbi:selenoprotein B, glycine/betaine/sarcosine/D-proline reductase family [Jonquetella anthropi DSM 22815]|nr:selenoprotein B, glycine/betaine/sarcosine/D-proline reductase domain protein [Jonquetella anthropi E3_33 E1]EHM13266.1 selenoprotein B, glycine/betaine/sarcosine/D-proline reductase family [Jonquetella anthropi DSM 22815]